MAAFKDLADSDLVALLKEGDHAAFTEIYRRYWPLLYAHARKMLREDDAPTDIVQEIFTNLWNRSAQLELDIALKAYLYAAVRNLVITNIEKGKRKAHYMNSLAIRLEYMAPVDEQVINRDFIERIEKSIAALPPKMREIFEMSRKRELSHKEIAEELSITDHNVKKTIHRALKILKNQISSILLSLL